MNGHELGQAVYGLIFLWVLIRLFQRRLGRFAEPIVGGILFYCIGAVVVALIGAAVGVPYPNQTLVLVVAIGTGAMWALFSLITWPAAHAKAMIKANRKAAIRKQRRQARVAQFRTDYLS